MNFSSFMEGLVSKDPPLDDNEYEVKYQESYRKAIETFNQRRNRPTEFPEDVFKLSLMQVIWNLETHTLSQSLINCNEQNATSIFVVHRIKFIII